LLSCAVEGLEARPVSYRAECSTNPNIGPRDKVPLIDYQKWLHERDRDRDDYDGHPDRTDEEIRTWALEHDLPYFDDELHFPNARIEYEEPDGRWDHDDIEVTTDHYRGAHAQSVGRCGFSCFGGSSARVGGRSPDPRVAEELI
jgi:hypothetical protein